MSLVNFITEQVCKSSLFRLIYKEIHGSIQTPQVHKLDSASLHLVFGASPPMQQVIRSLLCAGTTCLLLSSCTLSTGIKSNHILHGYPQHCRSYTH